MTHGISGRRSPQPFAFYDRDSSSLRTSQGTFDLGLTESSPTLPSWGWMSGGELYALPMSAPLTDGNDFSSLLPTPSSQESTPTDEFVEEVREHLDDPHKRLYLPGRKWHAQRTLSRVVPALLPTPGANDHTGGEGPTRKARQETGTGGPSLRDVGHLLPTPTTQDGANTGGPTQHERNSLPLNAVAQLLPGAMALLPTPRTTDSHGAGEHGTGGLDLRTTVNLLPTPTSRDSQASGGSTPSDVTLTDAVVRTRLGARTNPRFAAGSTPSDDPPPGQLTIGDA